MLLKRGINPNTQQGSHSLLIYWLELFPYYETGKPVKFEYWSRLLKMMLLHGAKAQDSAKFFNNITKRVDNLDGKDIPSQAIIDATTLLLSHGLDPNKPTTRGQTFWTEFLESVSTDKSSKLDRQVVVLTLLQIFTLFLRYGVDPTVFDYSITDTFKLWPKRLSSAKPPSLSLTTSAYKDEINEFIELTEREKAFHKSRELSGNKKASHHKPLKPKPTSPEKLEMAVRSVKS
jgi:hypothetical protein